MGLPVAEVTKWGNKKKTEIIFFLTSINKNANFLLIFSCIFPEFILKLKKYKYCLFYEFAINNFFLYSTFLCRKQFLKH